METETEEENLSDPFANNSSFKEGDYKHQFQKDKECPHGWEPRLGPRWCPKCGKFHVPKVNVSYDDLQAGMRSITRCREEPLPSWLIENFWPATGITTIVGGAGTGKSAVVAAVIPHLYTNTDYTGLYFCAESFRDQIERIAHSFSDDRLPEDIDNRLHFWPGPISLLGSEEMQELVRLYIQENNIDYVIIDTVQKTKGPNFDENSADHVGQVLTYLESLGIPILLISHTGKDESRKTRGSVAWETDIEQSYQTEYKRKKGTLKLKYIKSRNFEPMNLYTSLRIREVVIDNKVTTVPIIEWPLRTKKVSEDSEADEDSPNVMDDETRDAYHFCFKALRHPDNKDLKYNQDGLITLCRHVLDANGIPHWKLELDNPNIQWARKHKEYLGVQKMASGWRIDPEAIDVNEPEMREALNTDKTVSDDGYINVEENHNE